MQTQTFREGWRFVRCRAVYLRQGSLLIVLSLMLSAGIVGTAVAVDSSSTNYSVSETQFGIGSSLHDCSTNYCAKTSAGDTASGSTSSSNYSAQAGGATDDEPQLYVTVTGGNQDMGVLDDTHTGTATSTVEVRTVLSSGYVMQIAGASPSQGSHNLARLTSPSTSQPGTEQFGINMVANNTPAIGADPVDVPTGGTAGDVIPDNYLSPDHFMYTDGDIVAQSANGNSDTLYTLSMIINVSNVTPGGRYNGTYSAIVTPTF